MMPDNKHYDDVQQFETCGVPFRSAMNSYSRHPYATGLIRVVCRAGGENAYTRALALRVSVARCPYRDLMAQYAGVAVAYCLLGVEAS